ncbi:MAG TPA: Lrp/AsnC ligand binding domain-containing protein [Steroidobacteraceae bacterium]
MPAAIILLNVEAKETNQIAEALANIPGVTEVYSVAGHFDLVAILRVNSNEALADLVTGKIRAISGILKSQTLIAFRSYSPAEVSALFDFE